jgi:hypothetical protein
LCALGERRVPAPPNMHGSASQGPVFQPGKVCAFEAWGRSGCASKRKAPTPLPRLVPEILTPSKPEEGPEDAVNVPCDLRQVNADRDAHNASMVENGLEDASALRSGCFD